VCGDFWFRKRCLNSKYFGFINFVLIELCRAYCAFRFFNFSLLHGFLVSQEVSILWSNFLQFLLAFARSTKLENIKFKWFGRHIYWPFVGVLFYWFMFGWESRTKFRVGLSKKYTIGSLTAHFFVRKSLLSMFFSSIVYFYARCVCGQTNYLVSSN
jgi:hypothetical protein